MTSVLAALAAGACSAAASSESIATVRDAGETAASEPTVAASGGLATAVVLCGYAVAAALVVAILRRRRAFSLAPGVVPVERVVPLLAIAFFAILVGQMLGNTFALRLFATPDSGSPLEARAIGMLGGYAIQLPIAAALGLVLTPSVDARRGPRLVLAGVIAIVCIWPFVQLASMLAGMVQQALTRAAPPELGHDTLTQLASAPRDAWAGVVILCVVALAPAIEEVSYRGALQGAMRGVGMSASAAIALTSVVFVVMHLPAIPTDGLAAAVSGLLVLSLGLGIVRERSRALVPCIVAHALFNVANLMLTWLIATVPAS